MADLTTLADVEAWLRLKPGNIDEPLIMRLISAASDFVEQWCDRRFASQPYIETRDGTDARRMVFANTPVTAVSSVTIDGRPIPPGSVPSVPGYLFSETAITLQGYLFRRGLANVQLAYTAGFATIPLSVAQATIDIIALRYRELDRIGMASKAIAGETTAFTVKDMPSSASTLLQNFKRVVPV